MSEDAARCNFVVGQRVVCIDDQWPEVFGNGVLFPPRVPMLNEILTITSIVPGHSSSPAVYLTFSEIERVQRSGPVESDVAYLASYFRPLVERKTDISQFQKLLRPTSAKEFT